MKNYGWPKEDAESFESFLKPMLHFKPSARTVARDCLHHPWLQSALEMRGEEAGFQ